MTTPVADPVGIAVADGSVVVFDVLTWDEGWEFGHPTCVLRPVVRYSPEGVSAEEMVENICEDARWSGRLATEAHDGDLVDRQYPLAALKRRWGQNRGGKEFPRLHYTARRFRVRFFNVVEDDEDGLDFELTEEPNRMTTRRVPRTARCTKRFANAAQNEPAAWCLRHLDGGVFVSLFHGYEAERARQVASNLGPHWTVVPLYAEPPHA